MCQNNLKSQLANKTSNIRVCIICERKLIGRSDKVFCDIKCKNRYHREIKVSMKTIDVETHKILMRNYQILSGLMTKESTNFLIDNLALQRKGFHFQYITSFEIIDNVQYFYVYDHCFQILSNKRIIVTKSKNKAKISPFLFKRWKNELLEISKK
jgi:hypothetical protein